MLFIPSKASKRENIVAWEADHASLQLRKRGNLLNEVLKDGAETKLYLDYDEYSDDREWTPEEMAEKEAEVRGKVEELLRLFGGGGDDGELKPSYVLATRHGRKPDGRWKRSYRPYVSGLRVKYTDIPRMIWEARQQAFWDLQVYKESEQLLACVNGWKDRDDRRVLQPEPGTEDDILSYVAQHVDPEWPLIVFDDEDDAVEEQPSAPGGVNEDDARYAEDLVLECLDVHRADERREWIRVGMIMKYVGASYDAFEEFSRRSSKFNGSADCRRDWNGLRPAGRVRIGSLCAMAKQDNPRAFAKVLRERNERMADSVNARVGEDARSISRSVTTTLTDADAESVREVLKMTQACKRWACEELEDDGSLKLTAVGCRQCLVDPRKQHADSCVVSVGRGKGTMTLSCHVDGKRKLTQAEIRRLQVAFASMWAMKDGRMVAAVRQKDASNAHDRLVNKLEAYAETRSLKKMVDSQMVYRPVEGCPCAYEPYLSFLEYVQTVCKGDPDYRSSVRRAVELEGYLAKYNEDRFPNIVKDRDLLSFANGVLVLSEGRFVAYPAEELVGRVARHHIAQEYVGAGETPLFDGLLSAQLSPEVMETLMACMGRLFFEVGKMDNWQVMPYLVGKAGSGKSVVLDVVSAMFSPAAVATLSETQEKTFGLQSKYDKELIKGMDMPQKLSGVLGATLLQSMVTGEGVSVAIKGLGSRELSNWKVPMIMASNFMPDYLDTAGQVSRRLVAFNFRTAVKKPDMMLKAKILSKELPSVVHKVLNAYLRMRERYVEDEFYTWCPDELRESQMAVKLETDYVRRFLAAGPEDNSSSRVSIYVVQKRGTFSTMGEFKRAFGKYMAYQHRGVKWTFDDKNLAPFEELGYRVVDANWCKACNREAKGGAEKCCESYGKGNRTHMVRILGMTIVREETGMPGDPLEVQ